MSPPPGLDEASWPLDTPEKGGSSSSVRDSSYSTHRVTFTGLDVHFKLCIIWREKRQEDWLLGWGLQVQRQ